LLTRKSWVVSSRSRVFVFRFSIGGYRVFRAEDFFFGDSARSRYVLIEIRYDLVATRAHYVIKVSIRGRAHLALRPRDRHCVLVARLITLRLVLGGTRGRVLVGVLVAPRHGVVWLITRKLVRTVVKRAWQKTALLIHETALLLRVADGKIRSIPHKSFNLIFYFVV
jgi:hypothetical protein